ncbi:centrosomal protein of 70 kDa isoform X2 [Sphaeramia orbicularis]|uniref:centrosomal protein of 70 kDa isoform X2 n=1 Tax=Sphaeramia orbicularis TaxID=375764 RepID=UPI0011802E0B|nr:centrosomal protein of 70 kDa isoform X2 [Sphaeramia orbicularis]
MDGRKTLTQSGSQTYVYLWTCKHFQQEQVEWDDVNKLLQHHGFKPVCFADPVENKNLSDLVLLDKKSASEIRATLRIMLTDSERRQALIQELIKSNGQLKEDVQLHMSRSAQQGQRASELQVLLDDVRSKVQDLEDRCLGSAVQQHSQTQQLQQDRQEALKRCQTLEEKLSKQREETAQLQKKLYFTVKEEERRVARQSHTFKHICKKDVQQSSAADRQVLDVIDYYENKMNQLLNELRCSDAGSNPSSTVSPSLKTLLKEYQQQQKESRFQIEELKRNVDHLKQELDTRPTLKELKFYKHKLRRLEGFHNHRLSKDDDAGNRSSKDTESPLCAHYRQLLNDVSAILTNANAPLKLHPHGHASVGLEGAEFQPVVPILEVWAQQLHLMKDLQRGLSRLSSRLMPWQVGDGRPTAADAVRVEDMMLLVDAMLENTCTHNEKVLRSPTRHTLGSMVSHFQKLFDVTSLSGVYPRMNQVYAKLGEMTNAMRNLRDLLDLDGSVSPGELVNQVARLVSSSEQPAAVQHLLGQNDIDSIIMKVKQHEEFFPAFHSLVVELLQTLGVSRLDDILPALKSLKQTAP